jgi:hypothetical protein
VGSGAHKGQQVRLESEDEPEPKSDAGLPDAAAVELADAEPCVEMWLADGAREGQDRLEDGGALILAERPDVTLEALR